MKTQRETLEMLDGRVYFSTDGWVTIWRVGYRNRMLTSKQEIDNIRYLAMVQAGSTRNENVETRRR